MNKTIFQKDRIKFDAFESCDKKFISRWLLYPLMWTLTIRAILFVLWLTIHMLCIYTCSIGYVKGTKLSSCRKTILTVLNVCCNRVTLFIMGQVLWVKKNKPEVCYKKYLGEDWKPEYRNSSTIISNHTSLMDIFAITQTWNFSSYVLKDNQVNIFLLRMIELL